MADENNRPDEDRPEPRNLPEEATEQPPAGEEDREIPSPESAPLMRHLTVALRLLVAGMLGCSVTYPAVVSLAARVLCADEARGSILEIDGRAVGSRLVGQSFSSDVFFHPRPSSKGYDAMDSGSQNLGPHNEELTERVRRELARLRQQGIAPEQVPVGWVTESGSSLDPHITPAAARLQVPRVSRASGIPASELEELVDRHTEGRFIGLFGQQRVNVLLLNLEVQKRLDNTE